MPWHDGFYGYSMAHPLGWIMMIIFWGFLILGIIFIIKKITFSSGPDKQDTPLDIVKKRYARGEISKEDYERLKQDLEN